jgi:lipid A 3-O-deacylase
MKKVWLCIFIGLVSLNLQAQTGQSADRSAFSFTYANDVTGFTDQYYTNGVRFDLTTPIFSKSPFNPAWLAKKFNTTSYHAIGFLYDVFTPNLHSPLYTDRPFASVMMLSSKHQYVFAGNKLMLASELQLGVIGQATGAGKLQNGLHSIMPGATPVEGWETQIRNDLAINYIFSVDKQVHRSKYAEIIIGGAAYLGSPYTKIQPKVLVRMGLMEDYFNLLNSNPAKTWQAYIYGDFRGAYVAYNATLQGGPFNTNNPYVLSEIEPFTLDLQLGLGITYSKYTIILGQHLITPEFPGADLYKWGELTFRVAF